MGLAAHHLSMLLDESGIPEALVAQRGYFTVEDPKELLALGFSDDQSAQVPALVLPLYGVDGDIVGYQSRPDNPRTNDHGKPVKYETPFGWSMRLDVSPVIQHQLGDKSIPLWITEGVKKGDAAAARGLCCISLIGVWNWRGTNDQGGVCELSDWDKIALKGRTIYIVFDSDVMIKAEVKAALKRLAGMLKRRGASRVIPIVPPTGNQKKTGLDDYFVRGGTSSELMRCADETLLTSREIITNNRSLALITSESMDALIEDNIPAKIFVRGGDLVRVLVDERGIATISPIPAPALRGVLARCATFVRVNGGDKANTECFPPKDVCEDILSLSSWPFPPIIAVTKAPVFAGGKLSTAPGYHANSHYFVSGTTGWPAWEGDVNSAVQYLLHDLLGDFPFVDEASRANALAFMLLPIVRPAISGPTPLHLIDAPVQGSGKTLLAKVCLAPTAGSEISATTISKDESEVRKKITSSLLEGRTYIFFDNLTNKVDSESLASTLTLNEWYDRELNYSRNVTLPIRCTWVATGNNAELSRDIVRRSLWIKIDPSCDRPEMREGFRHPNIEQHIRDNRAHIVSALTKIVQHWIDGGLTEYSGKLIGSYEEYCKVIGGILESAGVSGFWANHEELRESADGEGSAWLGFVERWWSTHGDKLVAAKDLLEAFDEDPELAVKLGDKGDVSRSAKLSHALKRRVGMVLSGYKIARKRNSDTKNFQYHLESSNSKPPETTVNKNQTTGINLLDFESNSEDNTVVTVVSGGFSSRAPAIPHDARDHARAEPPFSDPTTVTTVNDDDNDQEVII